MKPARLDATCRYIFLYSKLWGMFPFRLVDGWKLQISKPALAHSSVMVGFSVFCFYKSMMSSKTSLNNFIFLMELFSLNLTIASSVVVLIFRHRRLSDVFFTLLTIQKRHGIIIRCRRYLVKLCVCSLFLLVILLYRLFALTNRNWNNVLFKIAYFIPTWMMFSSIMVFSSICLLIGESFVLIRAALLNPYRRLAELDFLLQTHVVLITSAESVSLCYGIQNLLVFMTSFFIFTSRIYTVLSGGSILSFLVAVFFYPYVCWNVVYICSETKRKAKMFTESLYYSALFDKQDFLSKNTKVPFHFATVREVKFSVCGLFILDFPLICSLTSAAASYLLILFQFSAMDRNILD